MRQQEGRPLPAILLLFSMFAFALVFHAVTRPHLVLDARFNLATPALRAPLASHAAVTEAAQAAPRARRARDARLSDGPALASLAQQVSMSMPVSAPESVPVLESTAWPVVQAQATSSIVAFPATQLNNEHGALTRAFSHGGAALRTAFRKVF